MAGLGVTESMIRPWPPPPGGRPALAPLPRHGPWVERKIDSTLRQGRRARRARTASGCARLNVALTRTNPQVRSRVVWPGCRCDPQTCCSTAAHTHGRTSARRRARRHGAPTAHPTTPTRSLLAGISTTPSGSRAMSRTACGLRFGQRTMSPSGSADTRMAPAVPATAAGVSLRAGRSEAQRRPARSHPRPQSRQFDPREGASDVAQRTWRGARR